MSVLSKLKSADVKLWWDFSRINAAVSSPAGGPSPAPPTIVNQANPLVSCLMLTRGNAELMKYSLACYQSQTYPNRELVVVAEPEAGDKVRAFIGSQKILNVSVFVAPPGNLGDHRNLAAAQARGEIIATWDDDDLSDPQRLEIAVRLLLKSGAVAAFLSRLLIWWPQRKLAAISGSKIWEGTMVAWRSHVPRYPSLARGEDSPAVNEIGSAWRVVHIDCPLLYIYAVTGRNTWEPAHFERFLSWADCSFEGDQFDELNGFLSNRLPVLDYAAVLNDAGAG
jgi:glycosyltransferase involved in cell wall biosynthesis